MEYKHNPPSLRELKDTLRPLEDKQYRSIKFTRWENLAVGVTRGVGTISFFFMLSLWTFLWLGWNTVGPVGMRFDPAPAFVIWLIISNIIQLILLPLIMVGQNLEGKFAERRAQDDFEIDTLAQKEIEIILAHLENQNEMLLELVKKIDRR